MSALKVCHVGAESVPLGFIALLDRSQDGYFKFDGAFDDGSEASAFRFSAPKPVQNQKVWPSIELADQVFSGICQGSRIKPAAGGSAAKRLGNPRRRTACKIFKVRNRAATATVGQLSLQATGKTDPECVKSRDDFVQGRIDLLPFHIHDRSQWFSVVHLDRPQLPRLR